MGYHDLILLTEVSGLYQCGGNLNGIPILTNFCFQAYLKVGVSPYETLGTDISLLEFHNLQTSY